MATDKPENPPAFPNQGKIDYRENGMDLRDWFAGGAMRGFCSTLVGQDDAPKYAVLARDAYAMADAMLAERSRK